MAKKLYIGSLPYDLDDTQLKELFSEAGTVESATIIKDRYSGNSKGFGFVEMSSDEEAKNAIDKFNGYKLGERNIIVNEARPMVKRSGGFSGKQGRGFKRGFNKRY